MAAILFQKYKEACKERGITIAKLCSEAGIERMNLSNWKKKDPFVFDCMLKLEAALKKFPIKEKEEDK